MPEIINTSLVAPVFDIHQASDYRALYDSFASNWKKFTSSTEGRGLLAWSTRTRGCPYWRLFIPELIEEKYFEPLIEHFI
jgi:hypothetical protein